METATYTVTAIDRPSPCRVGGGRGKTGGQRLFPMPVMGSPFIRFGVARCVVIIALCGRCSLLAKVSGNSTSMPMFMTALGVRMRSPRVLHSHPRPNAKNQHQGERGHHAEGAAGGPVAHRQGPSPITRVEAIR